MSTNFYAKHIPTEDEYAQMELALVDRQLDKLRELIDNAQKQYHIGKRMGGWQFLFVPHIKTMKGQWDTDKIISPWEDTLESIKAYLSREDVQIIDEYGEKFTPEQFWNEEIGDSLYHDKEKYINGEDYDYEHNNHYQIGKREYITEEGLRFATDDDWC